MLTFHFVSSTTKLNFSILAGSLGNSLQNMSRNSSHNERSSFCKYASPEKCICESTSTVEGTGNQGLKVSVLSWSISSSSGRIAPKSCTDSWTKVDNNRGVWATAVPLGGAAPRGWGLKALGGDALR